MVSKYNPPTFINDSETGPYLNDGYFNIVGAALKRSLDAIDVLESGAFYHNFKNKVNGPIEGQYADSGQLFISRGPVFPVVNNGMVGFPTGTTSNSAASYAMVEMPKVPTRIWGKFRFDPSDGGNTSVAALGCFTNTSMGSSNVVVRTPCHLSITPKSAVFQTATGPGDFPQIVPTGGLTASLVFPYPLKSDGITEYEVEIYIDTANKKCYCRIADFPVWEFHDFRIGIAEAIYPFYETFAWQPTEGYCGFTEIGADTRPLPQGLAAFKALSKSRAGQGSAHLRPPSKLHGGSTWYDNTLGKLIYSNGNDWVDFQGNKANNLWPENMIYPSIDANGIAVGNGAKSRRTPPPLFKSPLAWFFKSSANGVMHVYPDINIFNYAVPGQTYSFMFGELLGLTATRSAFLKLTWYDASYQTISVIDSPDFVIPATMPESGPVQSAIVSSVAPAGAKFGFPILHIKDTLAGDEFLIDRFCLAQGTIAGFVHK